MHLGDAEPLADLGLRHVPVEAHQHQLLLAFGSVDETVRRHKPAPEAYHFVATALGVDPADICLIACHVWDTVGAQSAGWQAGLILRPGNAPLGVGPQPDYIGNDLDAIADQLIDKYRPDPSE